MLRRPGRVTEEWVIEQAKAAAREAITHDPAGALAESALVMAPGERLELATYGSTVRIRSFRGVPTCAVTCHFIPTRNGRTADLRVRFTPDSPQHHALQRVASRSRRRSRSSSSRSSSASRRAGSSNSSSASVRIRQDGEIANCAHRPSDAFMGRPLLDYEVPDVPILDPATGAARLI